ncbi:hypothetical protein BVRB_4g085880 [Beta vulgaris subsp. vulgaris]|nr:hypothetical protein BVRB_4g085880 [Beta vulgaris subsp. vulgaris]
MERCECDDLVSWCEWPTTRWSKMVRTADVGRRWCEQPTTRWSKMVADYSLTADDYSLTVEDGERLDRNLVKQ